MRNVAAILQEILNEADALIRQRLKEQGLELPHLVVGATADNQIVVRSNGDSDIMRSSGEGRRTSVASLALYRRRATRRRATRRTD
jgi:hypothetical protein